MVKIPAPDDQNARATHDRRNGFRPSNHRLYGSRYGRRREEMRREPTTLTRLELLAARSAELMEKHEIHQNSENKFEMAMNLLRHQYNYNFMIVCDKCNGTHGYDPLHAPER